MSVRDDDRPDANGDRNRRRKLAVTGVAGLAVVAGVGAALLTNRTDDPAPPDLGAAAPIGAAASSPTDSPTATSAPASASASTEPMATADSVPAPTTKPAGPKTPTSTAQAAAEDKVRKKIEAARAKAAADGFPVQRPLTAAPGVAVESLDSYKAQSRTLGGGHVMRIYSAKGDLSNQREMLWAADQGEPVGDARCTQKFRFAENATPAVRPSMLLCWRITDSRSVVVLTTARKGTPSTPQSVKAINAQWNKLDQ